MLGLFIIWNLKYYKTTNTSYIQIAKIIIVFLNHFLLSYLGYITSNLHYNPVSINITILLIKKKSGFQPYWIIYPGPHSQFLIYLGN